MALKLAQSTTAASWTQYLYERFFVGESARMHKEHFFLN
jgi:hypothetical protein